MSSILVIDESGVRAKELCEGLIAAGHQVAAVLASLQDLSAHHKALSPDVVLIATNSPAPDMLAQLAAMHRDTPHPVVMLTQDGDGATMRAAFRAGVSAYVVDDLDLARLKPIVNVAIARFEEQQHLKRELSLATKKLSDRIVVERAKGILMKSRALDEDKAYEALRKLAMERAQPLAKVAADLVAMAKLLL